MLILGPAGTGKSLLALTFVAGAIKRGEKAAMFIFDEELGLLFERAKGLGIDLQAMVDSGNLTIEQVDAAELTPGELSARVRRCVEEHQAQTVVIDSLNGYQASMPEEQALILHMHELLQYLNRQGASTFLTVAQHGLVGDMKAPVDVTYLADTVILLALFRSARAGPPGNVGDQEADRRARRHDPRISHRRPRNHARRAADGLPGRPSRRARAGRRASGVAGARGRVNDAVSERALILAPQGRDGAVARGMLAEAGLRGDVVAGRCAACHAAARRRGLCRRHRRGDRRNAIFTLCRTGSMRSLNGPTFRSCF